MRVHENEATLQFVAPTPVQTVDFDLWLLSCYVALQPITSLLTQYVDIGGSFLKVLLFALKLRASQVGPSGARQVERHMHKCWP